jgi:large repetitive protein
MTEIPEKSDSASFEWTIIDDNRTPEGHQTGEQDGSGRGSVSLEIKASDEDSDNTLTFSAVNLPPGLSIDEDSGEISGVISAGAASGSPYSVTVTVTDDGSPAKEASASFTWTVIGEEGVKIFLPLVMK